MTNPLTNPSRVAEWAETSRRFVNQAGAVVLKVNDQITDGTFGSAQWTKSAHELINLALTAGLDIVSQIPCPPLFSELELSDFVAVDPDNEYQRVLTVAQPFAHVGAPSCVIPSQFIVFDPPIVRVYAKRFRVGVRWPDLRSATYQGRVRLTRIGTALSQGDELDVTVDL